MKEFIPRTWVPGTPRGWGNKKTENEWLQELSFSLEKYRGIGSSHDPNSTRYSAEFEFLIWPQSPKYFKQNLPHGTDLDNLVKNTFDCLTSVRKGGLGIIIEDQAVYRIMAKKVLVTADSQMGLWLTIHCL